MPKAARLLIFLGTLGAMSPTLSGLYPTILIIAVLAGINLTKDLGRAVFFSFFILAILSLGVSLSGILSTELITVVFTSGLLIYFFPQFIAIALLFLFVETPLFQTITLVAGSWLPLQLQQSSPILVYLLLSIVVFNRDKLKTCICTALVVMSSFINWHLNLDVLMAGLINSLIIGVFFSLKDVKVSYPRYKFYIVVAALSIHSLLIWSSMSQIDMGRILVWIPSFTDKYESQFFKNYSNTLSLAGIKATQITDISEISENSLVIVPWGTDIESKKFLQDLKKSPIGKSLTVLIGGEHTNYSGFADRLNPLFEGKLSFNNTTTVPPQNANHMGALWTGSVLQFPFDATINRGADLSISSLYSFPLLIAKSIFVDLGPKEFNDFWVGDFNLDKLDRRGWMLLMAAYRDGPLWILSGDNSFLMNRYLLPNPAPITHAISLATLFPMLLLELWILIVIFAWGIQARNINTASIKYVFIFLLPILILVIISFSLRAQASPNYFLNKALFQNLKYFGGDERSSAIAISANSKVIDESKKRLFVYEGFFTSKDIGNSGIDEIHIGHIKNGFTYNGIKIDNCDLTSYSNSANPKINLLEAQYCRVTGDARVIVGNKNQASVIEINSTPSVTLILDKYFLSGSAPNDANIKYLLKLLDGSNSP